LVEQIKVLVIDDHPLFRAALELALTKCKIKKPNIQSASTLADAISTLKTDDFSLILLDLNLSDSQDFEGLSKIKS